MSKIRVKDEVIDIAQCTIITIAATEIHFEGGGVYFVYQKGKNLTDNEFNTLSSWLTNQANNPYTVVI